MFQLDTKNYKKKKIFYEHYNIVNIKFIFQMFH